MHRHRQQGLSVFALFALTVPSCAESPTVLPPDAGPSDDAALSNHEPLVCDEVETWPTSNGTDTVMHRRYQWDPDQRIRTQESRSDPSFDGTVRLAWRYDSAGNEIAYAGFARAASGSSYGDFQRDNEYDAHGNVTDSRLSYPDKPNVSAPSSASVWMGSRHEHEYDAQDQLRASVVTAYGPGNSAPFVQRIEYGHDAAGRCETKLTNVEGRDPVTERFVYDNQDRLIEEHQVGRFNPPLGCSGSITVIEYDEVDRVTARRTWVCGRSMDARADIEIIHAYNSEGFRRTDTFDFITDVVNHMTVTPEGEERWASHTIETQSAECAKMAAAIGGPVSQRCRAL